MASNISKSIVNENGQKIETYKQVKTLSKNEFLVMAESNGELRIAKYRNISFLIDFDDQKEVCDLGNSTLVNVLNGKCPYLLKYHEVYKTNSEQMVLIHDYLQGTSNLKMAIEAQEFDEYYHKNQVLDIFTQICLAY